MPWWNIEISRHLAMRLSGVQEAGSGVYRCTADGATSPAADIPFLGLNSCARWLAADVWHTMIDDREQLPTAVELKSGIDGWCDDGCTTCGNRSERAGSGCTQMHSGWHDIASMDIPSTTLQHRNNMVGCKMWYMARWMVRNMLSGVYGKIADPR